MLSSTLARVKQYGPQERMKVIQQRNWIMSATLVPGTCNLEFSSSTIGVTKEWGPKPFYCRGQYLYSGERMDSQEFICSEKNGHRFGLDK
jgi:hypothetical protein